MMPFFASTFGNLYAFMLGAPTFAFAIAVGIVAVTLRLRALSVIAGIVCLAVAIWFSSSLEQAVEADRMLTIVISALAGITGVALIVLKRPPARDDAKGQP